MQHTVKLEDTIRHMAETCTDEMAMFALRNSLARVKGHDLRISTLKPQRLADQKMNIWTQFNLHQEYAIRGGSR